MAIIAVFLENTLIGNFYEGIVAQLGVEGALVGFEPCKEGVALEGDVGDGLRPDRGDSRAGTRGGAGYDGNDIGALGTSWGSLTGNGAAAEA